MELELKNKDNSIRPLHTHLFALKISGKVISISIPAVESEKHTILVRFTEEVPANFSCYKPNLRKYSPRSMAAS